MIDTLQMLKDEEGYSRTAYRDSEGLWTVGYGTLIEPSMVSWSPRVASVFLEARVLLIRETLCDRGLGRIHGDAFEVCVMMCYQLGISGFFKFKKTINFLFHGHYRVAAEEMLDSKWARQTPARAERMANIIRSIT
jgi:lysozyme